MTEDKKNTEETQEKEEFEVVMPEANRVEMPATEFKEQPDYLKTFANFYISKFDESDLEIMDVYDGNMHHEGSYIPNVHGGEDYLNLSGNGEAIMRYSDPLAHSNEFNMNPFDVNKY